MAKTPKNNAESKRLAVLNELALCMRRWQKESGQQIDAGTAALAYWLVDEGRGRVKMELLYRQDDQSDPRESRIETIYYKTDYIWGVGATVWDAQGRVDDAVEHRRRVNATRADDVLLSGEISVEMCNLSAVLVEWGCEKPDMALAIELAGEVLQSDGEKLNNSPEAVSADLGELNLGVGPFNNWNYLRFHMADRCSLGLRQKLVAASNPARTAVMQSAISHERDDWIKEMVDQGFNLDESRGAHIGADTALHQAAECSPKIVALLLSLGANVNVRDRKGRVPVHSGMFGESIQMMIAAGADVMAVDNEGITPLHVALDISSNTLPEDGVDEMQVVNPLLDAGADPFYVPANPKQDYLTPFQAMIKKGGKLQLELLARRFEVDWNQKTVAGRSLIQLCGKNKEMKDFLRSLSTQVTIEKTMEVPVQEEMSAPAKRHGFSPL